MSKKKDNKNDAAVTADIEEELEATAEAEIMEEVEATAEQTAEDQLKALEDAVTLAEDKTLRLQAEFQNYRKRTFKDINAARQNAVGDTVLPFLQVFDHFNMAVLAAKQGANMDAILQGMDMILNEYGKALDELGIKQFDATGEKFDPELHQAVANEPSDEVEEGTVIKQWSCGYKMGEKLMRPAMVVVSSGPATAKADEATTDEPATEE